MQFRSIVDTPLISLLLWFALALLVKAVAFWQCAEACVQSILLAVAAGPPFYRGKQGRAHPILACESNGVCGVEECWGPGHPLSQRGSCHSVIWLQQCIPCRPQSALTCGRQHPQQA